MSGQDSNELGSGAARPEAERILLLGNYRQTLAVTRSLGARGFHVVVGRSGSGAFAERSRFAAEAWDHPDPARRAEDFALSLRGFLAARPDVRLVFPIGDHDLAQFLPEGAAAGVAATLVMPAPEVVAKCQDKLALCRLAEQLGIPQAPFAVADVPARAPAAAEAVGLPCVVKPISPLDQVEGTKAWICERPGDLEAMLKGPDRPRGAQLVQRRVTGPRQNLYFVAQDGRLLALVQIAIRRTDRPDGTGLAVEGVTVEARPDLLEATAALVRALGYTGVGCAQFLIAPGVVSFLELNPRLGANFGAIPPGGLDFSEAAVRLAKGQRLCPSGGLCDYPTGWHYAWTQCDLRGLKAALARREIGLSEAFLWMARLLRALVAADVHVTWRRDDPGPTLAAYAEMLGSLLPRPLRARLVQQSHP